MISYLLILKPDIWYLALFMLLQHLYALSTLRTSVFAIGLMTLLQTDFITLIKQELTWF